MPETMYDDFVTTLHKFVSDLDRYSPNDDCKKLLKNFKKLDMNKILLRYVSIMKKYELKLENQDESIFLDIENPCYPLPGLNLNSLWPTLASGQKKKIFTYLKMQLLLSNMIIQSEKSQQDTVAQTNIETPASALDETTTDTPQEKKLEFNPYEGIGGSADGGYSVEEMFTNMDCLQKEETSSGFGLGSIGKMLGVDNMINMDELTNQLNSMTEKDIDETTESIQKALGNNDPKTAGLLSDMLNSLKAELVKEIDPNNPNNSSSNSNPLDTIMRVANTVAKTIKPKMQQENVDIADIFGGKASAGATGAHPFAMLGNMLTSAGGEGGEANPLGDILGQLMGAMGQPQDGETGGTGPRVDPLESMIKQMMGGGDSSSGGENNPMAQMMSQMMGSMGGGGGGRSNSSNPLEQMMGQMMSGGNKSSNPLGDMMGQMMQQAIPKRKKNKKKKPKSLEK